MPASPRDFLLYSRMTGKPMPENAMERMRMAPEVYQFTKNFAKQPNLLEKTGNLARSIGRGAVMAIGAPMVAEAVAAEADRKEKEDVTGDVKPEMEVVNQPVSEAMQIEQEKTKRKQIEIEGRKDLQRMASGVVKTDLNQTQESTTADNFEQDVIPQQTTDEMAQRSATQQAELETNQTIADNASQSQDFTPQKSDLEMDAEIGARANIQKEVDKFLGQSKLDPILLAAMSARGQQEELVGTSFPIASPLSDNPQTPPGQTNTAVSQPFATSIEPITNPSPNLTPQMQSVLNTLAKSRADLNQEQRMDLARKMTEGSPNEVVGEMVNKINQINESSDKLVDVMRGLAGKPTKEQQIEADQANSRILQKTAAKNREKGRINEKFYPTDVARTDIQIGGMKDKKTGLGKSVGISYTPLNGDTKVGFNIMSDPTKPQDVSTFDFVASPKTMESLQSKQEGDLGALAFGKLFNIAKKKQEGFSGMEM
tara:strand:+ start:405 stop:1853 length:1449 start_codon:yes stop_codon:yes gene_type:complete